MTKDGAFDEAVKECVGIAHVASNMTFSTSCDEVERSPERFGRARRPTFCLDEFEYCYHHAQARQELHRAHRHLE